MGPTRWAQGISEAVRRLYDIDQRTASYYYGFVCVYRQWTGRSTAEKSEEQSFLCGSQRFTVGDEHRVREIYGSASIWAQRILPCCLLFSSVPLQLGNERPGIGIDLSLAVFFGGSMSKLSLSKAGPAFKTERGCCHPAGFWQISYLKCEKTHQSNPFHGGPAVFNAVCSCLCTISKPRQCGLCGWENAPESNVKTSYHFEIRPSWFGFPSYAASMHLNKLFERWSTNFKNIQPLVIWISPRLSVFANFLQISVLWWMRPFSKSKIIVVAWSVKIYTESERSFPRLIFAPLPNSSSWHHLPIISALRIGNFGA